MARNLAEIEQVLDGERGRHSQRFTQLGNDARTEIRLTALLLLLGPILLGLSLLAVQRRVKQPLQALEELLAQPGRPDTILVIEDERLLGAELCTELTAGGWDAVQAFDLAEAERLLIERNLEPLVVLSDMSLPDGNALDLLERVRGRGLGGEWILLTAYGGIPESVRALKLGAFDFLEKPCELERLLMVIAGAARSARAQRRLRDEEQARGNRYAPEAFIGHSRAAAETRDLLARLARVRFSALLITGESGTGTGTGTGKGLAARTLHNCGPRASTPLIEVNCAALPRELIEAEIFGHEAGAFTAAKGRRRGLIEQANGGTLFLDGSLSLDAMERAILKEALERNADNVSLTARVLGTTRERLRYRVQKYGLKASD